MGAPTWEMALAFWHKATDSSTYDVPTYRVSGAIARKNRVTGARHGLKLINGSRGNLPVQPDGTGGFTVAAENGVYIRGNYNANASGFGDPSRRRCSYRRCGYHPFQ